MTNVLKSRKLRSLIPYFLLALAVMAAYKAIDGLDFFVGLAADIWSIITPFFYGFLLAYIINIPCSGIENLLGRSKNRFVLKKKKGLSLLASYVSLVVIVYSVLNLVIPTVYSSASLFMANFPSYYEDALAAVAYFNSLELFGMHTSVEALAEMLRENLQDFRIENLLSPLNALLGVSSAILNVFLAFISSIYILVEKKAFEAFLQRLLRALLSPGFFAAVTEYTGKLNTNFKKYIYTQTLDGLIIGSVAALELSLLRSPYALVLGIALGVINYIPYFGSIVGTVITVVIVAFTQDLPLAALAAAMLLVTQQIDGNIIQPRLMGDSFSLSPLLIIVCITMGGAFAGIMGMIAAIPTVAVLKDMLENIIVYREKKRSVERNELF